MIKIKSSDFVNSVKKTCDFYGIDCKFDSGFCSDIEVIKQNHKLFWLVYEHVIMVVGRDVSFDTLFVGMSSDNRAVLQLNALDKNNQNVFQLCRTRNGSVNVLLRMNIGTRKTVLIKNVECSSTNLKKFKSNILKWLKSFHDENRSLQMPNADLIEKFRGSQLLSRY